MSQKMREELHQGLFFLLSMGNEKKENVIFQNKMLCWTEILENLSQEAPLPRGPPGCSSTSLTTQSGIKCTLCMLADGTELRS